MFLVKSKNNTYSPCDSSDFEESSKIAAGSVIKGVAPRNYRHLKKAFALFRLAFENQSDYENSEVHRKILIIKSGYFDLVEGKDGHNYYFPKSLAFDAMSTEEFNKFYVSALDVVAESMQTAPETIKQELEGYY